MAIIAMLAAFSLSPAQPGSAYSETEILDSRFGAIEPHDAPQQADDLGIGWGRARFHWGSIQPDSPDQWIDAELSDEELANELDSSREVIGLLIGIPEWARGEDGLPSGLYLPHDNPDNLWAAFVRQAVSRYTGQINHWIIWNEPDVWDEEHIGNTWSGDEADYIQLLKVAYLVSHEENPDVIIHLGAVSHWWDVLYGRELYFKRFLDQLTEDPEAAQNDYYYDVATLHLYFNPASIYEVLEEYHQIQADHGIDKPFWLIETNAAPSSDPMWMVAEPTFTVSLTEQAAYMPQGLALALAGRAERVGIYKLIDTPGDYAANPEPFGIVRADGSPRPTYQTSKVAIQQLANAQQVTWKDQHVVAQVIIEKPNQLTRMFWSRIPVAQQIHIPALTNEATLTDMWGNESTLQAENGTYTLTLLGGECQQTVGDYCMIGGYPLYLTEDIATSLPLEELTLTVTAEGEQAVAANFTPTKTNPFTSPILALAIVGLILTIGGGSLIVYKRRITTAQET